MKQLLILISIFICSCASQVETNNQSLSQSSIDSTSTDTVKIIENDKNKIKQDSLDPKVGVKFLQAYIDNCNKMKERLGIVEWSTSSGLVTSNFLKSLNNLLDEADKIDPEYGLGFDPIFDAQDYPDKIKILEFDSETGFLLLQGVNWDVYTVTVKLVNENDMTLVDGCGIINIPEDKRAKRE